jgi:hypothetical protein
MDERDDYTDPEPGSPRPPSLGRLALILLAVVLAAGIAFAVVWFTGGEQGWYLT